MPTLTPDRSGPRCAWAVLIQATRPSVHPSHQRGFPQRPELGPKEGFGLQAGESRRVDLNLLIEIGF
jgi:hypothetical protein